MRIRVGQGFDVHPLKSGRPLVLGGVTIPHTHGLEGHSDADVLLHAIMDAILGAAGFQDIGHLFPNTDPAYKGISSVALLKRVIKEISQLGFVVENLDATVLAEEPKISPFIPEMKKILSSAIGISRQQIAIKATTTERLGFVGRKEGMAAMAVVLLINALE